MKVWTLPVNQWDFSYVIIQLEAVHKEQSSPTEYGDPEPIIIDDIMRVEAKLLLLSSTFDQEFKREFALLCKKFRKSAKIALNGRLDALFVEIYDYVMSQISFYLVSNEPAETKDREILKAVQISLEDVFGQVLDVYIVIKAFDGGKAVFFVRS